jgi:hypothetical protein
LAKELQPELVDLNANVTNVREAVTVRTSLAAAVTAITVFTIMMKTVRKQ